MVEDGKIGSNTRDLGEPTHAFVPWALSVAWHVVYMMHAKMMQLFGLIRRTELA